MGSRVVKVVREGVVVGDAEDGLERARCKKAMVDADCVDVERW